jgi:putative transposase
MLCHLRIGPFSGRVSRRKLPWLGKEVWRDPKGGEANASKFTDAQKAFVIKQGEEGTPVAEICRKAGISQATYFNWKKKYAGLLPSEMRRLRELEDENSRLKKIVADLTLDREMLQDVIKRPEGRRSAAQPTL